MFLCSIVQRGRNNFLASPHLPGSQYRDYWIVLQNSAFTNKLQCSAITTWLIFYKIITKDTHSMPFKVNYGVSFVSLNLHSCYAPVTAVMCTVSCYIVLHYNGTPLYLLCITSFTMTIELNTIFYISMMNTELLAFKSLDQGKCGSNFSIIKVWCLNSLYRVVAWVCISNLLSGKCLRTSLIRSQHWPS